MRKREVLAGYGICFIICIYYWIGHSKLEVLPALEDIINLKFTITHCIAIVAYLIACSVSSIVMSQGLEMWDTNDNEED